MSTAPRHGTAAGDAFLAVQKLARSTGGDVQELLTLYALEGLLARVASSPRRDDFVLKGGVLLAAFSLRRPTKDVDLQATGAPNDVDDVLERIREIAAIDVLDGLVFDRQTIAAHTIREDDDYAGVRVRLVAALGRARLSIGVDVNFGDPIWPAPVPIRLPRLVRLGQEPVEILGYPLPMVVAEKAVTALERGEANTRWRDFADIWTISCVHTMSAGDLRATLAAVAGYRRVGLRALQPVLGAMPKSAQAKWERWRRRQAGARELPEQFGDILGDVCEYLDPVLASAVPGSAGWSPAGRLWQRAPH